MRRLQEWVDVGYSPEMYKSIALLPPQQLSMVVFSVSLHRPQAPPAECLLLSKYVNIPLTGFIFRAAIPTIQTISANKRVWLIRQEVGFTLLTKDQHFFLN